MDTRHNTANVFQQILAARGACSNTYLRGFFHLFRYSNSIHSSQLPAIAKLFSSEMTLASAWIHLLVIDLFAARSHLCTLYI